MSFQRIRQAQQTGDALGNLTFAFCPSCFSSVDSAKIANIVICARKRSSSIKIGRDRGMQNEFEVQLKESMTLPDRRLERQREIVVSSIKLRRIRDLISQEYSSLSIDFSTEADAQIDTLIRRIGFLDNKSIDLDHERRMLRRSLDSISPRMIASEIRRLRRNIELR